MEEVASHRSIRRAQTSHDADPNVRSWPDSKLERIQWLDSTLETLHWLSVALGMASGGPCQACKDRDHGLKLG